MSSYQMIYSGTSSTNNYSGVGGSNYDEIGTSELHSIHRDLLKSLFNITVSKPKTVAEMEIEYQLPPFVVLAILTANSMKDSTIAIALDITTRQRYSEGQRITQISNRESYLDIMDNLAN
ncbi:MAG: hypothetical protein LBB18_02455, partial [Puniceicoccales bacterium]|nr:hypothetical protein [Puniceicoccales bacterium]